MVKLSITPTDICGAIVCIQIVPKYILKVTAKSKYIYETTLSRYHGSEGENFSTANKSALWIIIITIIIIPQ